MANNKRDMSTKPKKYLRKFTPILFALLSISIILYILFGVYLYNTRIKERLSNSTLTTLGEIASQQQFSVTAELSANIASIKSIAYSLVVFGYAREDILDYLDVIESYYDFNNITILDMDGLGVTSDGRSVDFSENSFYEGILMGRTAISSPRKSNFSTDMVIIVATPIFEYGKIVGLVSAEVPLSDLNNLLLPSFNGNGYAFVVNDDGSIIARTENDNAISTDNLFDTLKAGIYSDVSAEQVIESIIVGDSGTFSFTFGEETRILEYRPLSLTGWSLVLAIPDEVLNENTSAIIREMNTFNLKLLLGTFVSIFIVLFVRTATVNAIKKAAYYDSLTGISNLTKFKIDVSNMLHKNQNEKFTIVCLDIANFKSINDLYDFTTGDKALIAIAETGRTVTDKKFLQARMARDEFLLFCTYDFFKDLDSKRMHYEAVFRDLIPEIIHHSLHYRYGRYAIEDNNEDVNSIVNKVLVAHSYAKNNKMEKVCDYNDDFRVRLLKDTSITNKQKAALLNNEFKVFLQPKCQLKDGSAVGAEALVRWHENDGNMIFPNDFIPLFENNGFIVQLDMYMLEKVCETLASWKEKGYTCIPISVNFSRRHLEIANLAEKIAAITTKHGIDRHFIEIELTEGIFLENENILKELLLSLHEKGFSLSMDDFGTGYSSLGLLHSLPVDVIKLDRSFFTKTEEAERASVIVESVAQMTHRLGIPTVAEGVETKDQVEFLKNIGCEMAQGYYYSKPLPLNEFEEKWLTRENS